MDIVSYFLIMFPLFGNRDNMVGYYQFPQSSKLLFPFYAPKGTLGGI